MTRQRDATGPSVFAAKLSPPRMIVVVEKGIAEHLLTLTCVATRPSRIHAAQSAALTLLCVSRRACVW